MGLTQPLESKVTSLLRNYPRIRHALLVPGTFITSAVDAIVSIGYQIAVIRTAGRNFDTWEKGVLRLCAFKDLFAWPFKHLVQAINLKATFPDSETFRKKGLLTVIAYKLDTKAQGLLNDKGSTSFTRHFLTRALYVGMIPCCVVTRVADGVIGVPLGIVALIALGRSPLLNHTACRALQAPALVSDLFYCCVKVMNPQAGKEPPASSEDL
jgi:hypothetical protein